MPYNNPQNYLIAGNDEHGVNPPTAGKRTPIMPYIDRAIYENEFNYAAKNAFLADCLRIGFNILDVKPNRQDLSISNRVATVNRAGADAVGTTLSGYTPYSKNPILFGTIPSPDPDYEIIKELKEAGVKRVIAEGRINDGKKMKKCLEAGAYGVVIGTSITEPKKIVKTILYDVQN